MICRATRPDDEEDEEELPAVGSSGCSAADHHLVRLLPSIRALASSNEGHHTAGHLRSQNGPGVAASRGEYFDTYGNLTWQMDERGLITSTSYDIPTGAVTQRIDDVDT